MLKLARTRCPNASDRSLAHGGRRSCVYGNFKSLRQVGLRDRRTSDPNNDKGRRVPWVCPSHFPAGERGKNMRARSFPLCAILTLVSCVHGGRAQSTDAPAAQSIAVLTKQAASGDAKAQYALGQFYAIGHGVPQDYSEAAR